jgi:hypothetical protein
MEFPRPHRRRGVARDLRRHSDLVVLTTYTGGSSRQTCHSSRANSREAVPAAAELADRAVSLSRAVKAVRTESSSGRAIPAANEPSGSSSTTWRPPLGRSLKRGGDAAEDRVQRHCPLRPNQPHPKPLLLMLARTRPARRSATVAPTDVRTHARRRTVQYGCLMCRLVPWRHAIGAPSQRRRRVRPGHGHRCGPVLDRADRRGVRSRARVCAGCRSWVHRHQTCR